MAFWKKPTTSQQDILRWEHQLRTLRVALESDPDGVDNKFAAQARGARRPPQHLAPLANDVGDQQQQQTSAVAAPVPPPPKSKTRSTRKADTRKPAGEAASTGRALPRPPAQRATAPKGGRTPTTTTARSSEGARARRSTGGGSGRAKMIGVQQPASERQKRKASGPVAGLDKPDSSVTDTNGADRHEPTEMKTGDEHKEQQQQGSAAQRMQVEDDVMDTGPAQSSSSSVSAEAVTQATFGLLMNPAVDAEEEDSKEKVSQTSALAQGVNQTPFHSFSYFGGELNSFKAHLMGSASCVDTLPQGLIATGGDDCLVKIWRAVDKRLVRTLQGHPDGINSVCSLADANAERPLLAATSEDSIFLWNYQTGQCLATLRGHNSFVWCLESLAPPPVTKTPILPMLASGGADRTVVLWDLGILLGQGNTLRKAPSGDEVHPWATLQGHRDSVYSLASLDKGFLASGSTDHTIIVWNAFNRHKHHALKGHTDAVTSLCSLTNDILVSGSMDNSVRLWNAMTGLPLNVLTGHPKPVTSVAAFASQVVISGSQDGTIRLWDAADGYCFGIFQGHEDGDVNSLAILTHGKSKGASKDEDEEQGEATAAILASTGDDGNVVIWGIMQSDKAN